MNKIYWDTPQGELYNFKDKSELVQFLNKTQIHFEVESFSGNNAHGISIKFNPDDADDIFSDGEYAVEHQMAKEGEYFYCLPMHNPNPYCKEEEQYASTIGFHYGVIEVKEEDVTLDSRWEFPCNVFIWIENTADRLGSLTINLFSVWPVGSERTVAAAQSYESTHATEQIARLEQFIELEKKSEEERKKS